ncbi:hypothetical protein [Sphingobium sp. Sx8-8]|uniref:hypothetical protein n=1 Tax=Sphingobium sp. Sx8-8 TaxID=2933617 RepID=UPI001F5AA58D|nr:hypothetical protein [Sphingobium sp. Sx8-8]
MAWEAALEFGLQQLAHAALDRALNGTEEPVFFKGEQVGTRTRFDERLTMFLLANPARIGRHPLRRECLLDSWEALLDYVEKGPLDHQEAQQQTDRLNETREGRDRLATQQAETDAHLRGFYEVRSHHAARMRAENRARSGRTTPNPHPVGRPPHPR